MRPSLRFLLKTYINDTAPCSFILFRQFGVDDGQIVDGHGHVLETMPRGVHFEILANDKSFRRHLDEELQKRRLQSQRNLRHGTSSDGGQDGGQEFSLSRQEREEVVRGLAQNVPVATIGKKDVHRAYHNSLLSIPQTVSILVDGVEYTGKLAVGMSYTESNKEGCEEFNGVREEGTKEPVYMVTCCGKEETCQIFDLEAKGRYLDLVSDHQCFPPTLVVDVKGKGTTLLKDVRPGDQVLAQDGKYQLMYTISHQSMTVPSEYVQLTTREGHIIELTDKHMIFLDGKASPVPAGMVKVGDKLIGDGSKKTNEDSDALEVIKISSVLRDGYIHLLTVDGTIVANGILASTHISQYGPTEEYLFDFWGSWKFLHADTLDKWIERPFRRLCLEVSPDLCGMDYMYKDKEEDYGPDAERNGYGVIGQAWRNVCTHYGFSHLMMGIGFIILATIANILATPSLVVVGLFLVFILSCKNNFFLAAIRSHKIPRISIQRMSKKKVKSM